MYNSADEEFDSTFQTNVVVRNNGSCLYVPPGIFKSMCKIDITWFPFDDQKCQMKFGSWTYGGFSLDLRLATEDGGDLSSYITNGEWQLLEVPGVRNSLSYTCCPEPYIDITYTIHLRRRTLYYGFNLIIPCMVISSMTLLGFTLPPESGEKISLGVTILLSMSVFMLQLTETLPPTSDAVSIIGTYFACIMVMVACSVIMTVIVINLHHRSAETCDMPPWVKVVVLTWLPIILRMSRPKAEDKESTSEGSGAGSPEAPCSPGSRKGHSSMGGVGGISSINGQLKDYADHQRHLASHKEIMANVLDLDDDYLQLHNLRGPSTPGDCNCYMNTLPLPQVCQRHGHTGPHGPHGHTFNTPVGSHLSSSFLAPPGGINVKDTIIDHPPPGWANSGDSPRLDNLNLDPCALDSTAGHTCQIVREISSCLRELKYITNRMRDNDDLEKIVQDWKFAAAIIDRLCFYAFTAFTIISTFVCLSSAPQLIV
ncbi:Neuronal acetylcholine receptor subunit alpha-7 [Halotydeus destructor]|nr:Neuronal acetylcholine receptor subunit alpha-7 [Halotydeus destructor]